MPRSAFRERSGYRMNAQPAYRLVYFDIRGRAEPIRHLFAVAGVPFVDDRCTYDEFLAAKHRTPFQSLPFLDVDGILLGQSHAIMRFLARQFGYAGRSALDEAIVDSLADRFKDFCTEIEPYTNVTGGIVRGNERELFASVLQPACNKFFKCIEIFLQKSQSAFLVGSSLTYVDLFVSESLAQLADRRPSLLDGYPVVEQYIKEIRSIPRLRRYIDATRRD